MRIKDIWKMVILAAILLVGDSVFGVLSGSGTEANPYLIQSRAEFDEFANPANATLYWASGKYTKLMCNLDLSGTAYTQAVIAPDYSLSFKGVFDGNGHVVSNLTINQSTKNWIGLFGWINTGGRIQNLGMENVNISGRDYVGGLVGNESGGVLRYCYITGSINGADYVGGLAGIHSDGTITACYARVNVTGNSEVGGLAGRNNRTGNIQDSYSTGNVAGYSYVGGLAGSSHYNTITACYATGPVTGTDLVGGLVGGNFSASITNCYASGSVSGIGSGAGGLVGVNGSASGGSSGTITASYARGSVVGSSSVGGLAGSNSGLIAVCFWDTQTSSQSTSAGGTGKTTAEMMTLSTFTGAGWDFINTWGIGNGQTYPYLKTFNGINPADINYSGTVDLNDLAILAANWMQGS